MNVLSKFDVRQTNIAKGLAVLMLLWHHLFFNNPNSYDNYVSLYKISGVVPLEAYFSAFCKLCVAIFVFLSGYGLYFSYEKNKNIKYSSAKFIATRMIKLLSEYWFIFIIFVPLGFAFGRNPIDIYEGNVGYFFADIFGLSDILFGSKKFTMNATWWFMSLIIILYIIYPVVYKLIDKICILPIVIAFGITFINWQYDRISFSAYFLPFVLGSFFAKYKLFDKLCAKLNKINFVIILCVSILFIGLAFVIRQKLLFNVFKFDGVFCIPIILFSYLVISKITVIDKIFEQLGKYSGSIFMFHTFIFSYYFRNFIYSFKYSILIFLVLTIICYLIALVLEKIKKYIKYDSLFNLAVKKCMKQ